MRSRKNLSLMAIGLVFLASGCVEKSVDGNRSVYGKPWWVSALIAGGGFLCAVIGWAIWRSAHTTLPRLGGIVLMTVAPILAGVVAFGMTRESLAIDDGQIEHRLGLSLETKVLRFAECRLIEFRKEVPIVKNVRDAALIVDLSYCSLRAR
jgi:hypothetical protein